MIHKFGTWIEWLVRSAEHQIMHLSSRSTHSQNQIAAAYEHDKFCHKDRIEIDFQEKICVIKFFC